jgi:hypothetical protein
MNFVFIIYSCKKYKEKSDRLYHLLKNRLEHCECYIIFGDTQLASDYEIIEDKYIALKCGDHYENLSEKSMTLFKVIDQLFPSITGIFKCDDDIVPNISKLNELIHFINENKDIQYLGNVLTNQGSTDFRCHYNKCSSDTYNVPMVTPPCKFATGPLYYVSKKSIEILAAYNRNLIIAEDIMVGYVLEQNKIDAVYYKTYYDHIQDYDKGCVQNINNENLSSKVTLL